MKTIRQTSIDCFIQIKEEGLLTKSRLIVLKGLLNNAPCTANEVFYATGLKTNQSGRFTELRDLGVIREVRTRKCNITNRTAIEWDLTDRLPNVNLLELQVIKPKNLKKCINYIIFQMEEKGMMWIDANNLKNIAK